MKSTLMMAATLLRGLGALIGYWKPLLVILFFLSPTGPHLRWTQSYVGSPDHPRFIRCDYLGARGIVATNFAPDCPLIVWIDAREGAS
ncbi:MAG: hypothetical protein MRY74_00350 [Neomegalonema sp.]|nr:hypothetical protein [Neomegalonema sp.]